MKWVTLTNAETKRPMTIDMDKICQLNDERGGTKLIFDGCLKHALASETPEEVVRRAGVPAALTVGVLRALPMETAPT